MRLGSFVRRALQEAAEAFGRMCEDAVDNEVFVGLIAVGCLFITIVSGLVILVLTIRAVMP